MKERGILFSASMVRALLAGTKTQTRRVVKPQPDVAQAGRVGDTGLCGRFTPDDEKFGRLAKSIACPYGVPGDRLWVREAFRFPSTLDMHSPAAVGDKALDAGYSAPWCPTYFEADTSFRGEWRGFVTPPAEAVPGRLRAGMHMPRWASRITLEVMGVRVERLQDISEADCWAEGIEAIDGMFDQEIHAMAKRIPGKGFEDAVPTYACLWESINGPDSWTANCWVWVVEFRRLP